MQTRSYSICRRCSAVYPSERRCPTCDGDQASRALVEAAIAHAVETSHAPRSPALRRGAAVVAGVIALSLVAGLGMLALAFV
jgi:RNA polymerase subunit RPABC4/transcription elongation factor Spt4